MYEIQANAKGSRQIKVDDSHLETIRKYSLFNQLIDSNGIVDEDVLSKLRLNVRALVDVHPDYTDLVDLCQNVLYHDNMKAYGLEQLIKLYAGWANTHREVNPESEPAE